jgi:hypothetical protein
MGKKAAAKKGGKASQGCCRAEAKNHEKPDPPGGKEVPTDLDMRFKNSIQEERERGRFRSTSSGCEHGPDTSNIMVHINVISVCNPYADYAGSLAASR